MVDIFLEDKTKLKGKVLFLIDQAQILLPLISLKGNYTVMTLTEREETSFQRQAAEDFIQSRLYGAGSCRSTSKKLQLW